MPDIVATSGSATANSFVTADAADTYLDGRLNSSAWTSATADDKARALMEATREISVLNYHGQRTDGTQALSFPREFLLDPDDPNSFYFTNTEIPQRVKDATCEMALEFLKAGTTDLGVTDSNAGVILKTIGPITTQWASPADRPAGLFKYSRVLKLLAPLRVYSASSHTKLVRG